MKPACERMSQLASDSFERPLSFKENLQLKLHISMCSLCRNYHKSLHTMSDIFKAIRQHEAEDESITLPATHKQRIQQNLSKFD